MMRIAIAGGGGFANILVRELSESAHALIVLSTQERPEFDEYDCQVAVVDYDSMEDLRFILQGVDLVISTICGTPQINLIDAARRARVRCFVPSEFEGALSHRPSDNDPLDRGSSTALDYLRRWSTSQSHPMKFTVFSCGIFYERLAPGGLDAYKMGYSSNVQDEGNYLVNLRTGTAEIPEANAQGRSVHIAMTSVFDVAKFVAAAVNLGLNSWPSEFKMRGAHMTTKHLVEICEEVRGDEVPFNTIARPHNELVSWLQHYEDHQDWIRWHHMQQLVQTANGRFNFSNPNLNELVPFQTVGFRTWLQEIWGSGVV
ncbi:hypothetical protein PG999_013815 [Apiospora kogelbergensis]|uniref:NmrA-like domain-containing protein n=1 Tax=Apiospora kogelbergensis TaxID=1337665 RepID=A0AAW0QDB2_9PEZI